MFKATHFSAKLAVLATAALLTAAGQGQAQQHRGGRQTAGGAGAGHYHAQGSGYHDHFHAQGTPYRYLGYRDGFYHYGSYGGIYGANNYGYYGGNYDAPGYFTGNIFPDVNVVSTPGSYRSFYPPSADPTAQPPALDTAMIDVAVPAGAELWLYDYKSKQTGSNRLFITPTLTAGQVYTYELRATWMSNGILVTKTRQVQVQSSKRSFVNFME